MIRHWFLPLGALAIVAVLLAAPDAQAQRFGVRVGVGNYYPYSYYPSYYRPYSPYSPFYSAYNPYALPYANPYTRPYVYGGAGVPWWYLELGNPSPPPYYVAPGYTPTISSIQVPQSTITQSYYPPIVSSYSPSAPAAPAQDPNVVLINLRVPDANAEVLIDGVKTTRQGTSRQFVSPPLPPGKKFNYTIEAKWTEDGKPVSQTRRIVIQAGETIGVDFTQSPRADETVIPRP